MNAEVLLICDPAFRVAAKISGREIFGVVRGMGVLPSGHPLVRMEFINKDSKKSELVKRSQHRDHLSQKDFSLVESILDI